jgi:ABC-type transport system substrate-binding protein
MEQNYWSQVLRQRIGRRRAIVSAGGTAAAAAFLAACGGGDSGSAGVKGDKSGLLTDAVDTLKQAKAGGTVLFFNDADPGSLDPHFANRPAETVRNHTMTRLLLEKPGYFKPGEAEAAPDLAESYEWSADGTQITFKLRQGVKWHNKPPVNGRALEVQDILFSWERLTRVGTNRGALANVVNPDAPITSVTAPDARTIVVKMKEPLSYVLSMLAYSVGGSFNIMPKETDSTFDVRSDVIGTGPFVLTNNTPSVGLTFKKNPEFYVKGEPQVDQIEMPIVTEYATGLAQFKTGNIHNYPVRGEDILTIKRESPGILMYKSPVAAASAKTGFGYLPGSPFHDERVRQAYSMSLDRSLWIDAFYNVSKFEAEGLPVEVRWHTHLLNTQEGWWLDPQGKDFGPNAKYFELNLAEAKKLMAAAGHANGLDVLSTVPAGTAYGRDYLKQVEAVEGMAREVGFRPTIKTIDYTSTYIPQIRNARGKFDGWTHKLGPGFAEDASARLDYDVYSKGGENFYGFDAAGKGDQSGDPELDALLERAHRELDTAKRKQLVNDTQRYLAKKMYLVYWPGGASGFDMAWAAVKNFNVNQGPHRGRVAAHWWWLDQTLPPFKT